MLKHSIWSLQEFKLYTEQEITITDNAEAFDVDKTNNSDNDEEIDK
jgi:hypothetical protein